MEIHELNTKALTDPAYVPFDDGTDTYKAEFNEVVENAANAAVAEADLTNNSVAFTSGDAASPTAWTSVSVITTGSTLATLFNRISTMVKNVRWLYSKLGTTDISSIGNGTVTGALSTLNGKVVSGIIKTLDAYTESYNLNTIYSNQENNTIAIINGQSEQNIPSATSNTIHFVLSFRRTGNYGYQYLFGSSHIFFRSINGASWNNWAMLI